MIAAAEGFRERWEAERERPEIAELEELASMLQGLYGGLPRAPQTPGSR